MGYGSTRSSIREVTRGGEQDAAMAGGGKFREPTVHRQGAVRVNGGLGKLRGYLAWNGKSSRNFSCVSAASFMAGAITPGAALVQRIVVTIVTLGQVAVLIAVSAGTWAR